MGDRAKYGAGQAKRNVGTRLTEDDYQYLSQVHEQPATALRIILRRYRAMCEICQDSFTKQLDPSGMEG